MSIQIGVTEVLTAAALLLSIYSTIKTIGYSKNQDKLNKLLLEKEQQQSLAEKQADISANFVKVDRNHHRLKIFNRGKATATNVRLGFPNGNDIIVEADLEEKFPMPTLEPLQWVEVIAAPCNESPSRMNVKLTWDDPSGENREKLLTIGVIL